MNRREMLVTLAAAIGLRRLVPRGDTLDLSGRLPLPDYFDPVGGGRFFGMSGSEGFTYGSALFTQPGLPGAIAYTKTMLENLADPE